MKQILKVLRKATYTLVALSFLSVLSLRAQTPRLLKEVAGVRVYGMQILDKQGARVTGYVENTTDYPQMVYDPEVQAKFSTRMTSKTGIVTYNNRKVKVNFSKLSKGFLLAAHTQTPMIVEQVTDNEGVTFQGLIEMQASLRKVVSTQPANCMNSAFRTLQSGEIDTIYTSGNLVILGQLVATHYPLEGFFRYDIEIIMENNGTAELAMPNQLNLCYQGQLMTEAINLPNRVKPGKSKVRLYEGMAANFAPEVSIGFNF